MTTLLILLAFAWLGQPHPEVIGEGLDFAQIRRLVAVDPSAGGGSAHAADAHDINCRHAAIGGGGEYGGVECGHKSARPARWGEGRSRGLQFARLKIFAFVNRAILVESYQSGHFRGAELAAVADAGVAERFAWADFHVPCRSGDGFPVAAVVLLFPNFDGGGFGHHGQSLSQDLVLSGLATSANHAHILTALLSIARGNQ
mgnify:CR=1 FL=1